MSGTAQMTIWEHTEAGKIRLHEELNGLGPFRLYSTEDVCRFNECANYDGCLTFAAANKWASFTCRNCRKAAHGEFVQED
jgi:hypothetical protein